MICWVECQRIASASSARLPVTAPQRLVTAASVSLPEALCLRLCQSSSFPYCRSSGWRLPHSYMVLTVATRYQFCCCPDCVCDMLTGPEQPKSLSRYRQLRYQSWRGGARRSMRGAAGGSSVDPDTCIYRCACRLWHLSCSPL